MSDTITLDVSTAEGQADLTITFGPDTGADGGEEVTSITGALYGMAIDGEVDPGVAGTQQNDGSYIWDNEIFTGNANGVDGSYYGIDNDGLYFSVNDVDFNLWSEGDSFLLGSGGAGGDNLAASVDGGNAPCYCRGTMILTDRGEVAVEDLRAGDMLVTRFGPLRPVKWIGRSSFNGIFLRQEMTPVRIRAGALGANLPRYDLLVSPAHAMVMEDHLVPAHLLVNGVTITQQRTTAQVDYFHIDLGVHDCVIAEGVWSESYAPQNNRKGFHNVAEYEAAFPHDDQAVGDMCLPMVGAHDPQLASILTAVRANMAEINFTANADVHLMANETRLDPVAADGENYVFRVPAGVTSLRLVSLASTPAITGINDDRRLLGLSIRSITFECCSRTTMLLANDPVFTDGFHDLEGTAPDFWRWTNGDAPLPVAELGVGPGETVITLAGTCMPRYILAVPTLQQPVPSFSAA